MGNSKIQISFCLSLLLLQLCCVLGIALADGMVEQDTKPEQTSDIRENIEDEREVVSMTSTISELSSFGASVWQAEDGIYVELPDVSFDSDSEHLSYEARHSLDATSRALRKAGAKKIIVQGHSDIASSALEARKISEARAKVVAELFVNNGISSDLISTKGYGLGRPIASNNTEQGRALNRRVDLFLQF